ncbi:MAG: hypothetical protein V4685_05350 [Bacteroidota bacterium]
MKQILCILAVLYLCSCGSSNKLKKYYTPEDKTVFELLERLQKNAADKEAIDLLPGAYKTALDKRKALNEANYSTLPPGDRYMNLVKEYGVMQQMYEQISALPAAKKVVADLWDPSVEIIKAKNNAAKEYYNQGLEYMTYDNRQAAKSAYDYFNKANRVLPGYENVRTLMTEALDRATIKVIVRAANYYNYDWNYWGFQNDWLQQQIINDLNNQSYSDTRFYSDIDANNRRIRADRIVELNFTELYVGQAFNDRYTINRSTQVQTGSTKSNPPQPIYSTVYAKVYVTKRYMQSRATLECRIYDQATGQNLLYDRFPGYDNWKIETATYTGDKRALEPSDWTLINNSSNITNPTRSQVADRLVRSCYNLLLSRIKSGVQFGN